MMKNILLLLACFSSSPFVLGQIEPIEDGANWEIWHDPVPISGRLEVGFMNYMDSITSIPKTFFSTIPSGESTTLCVEVYSQNGVYEAQREYKVPGKKKKRVVEFSWPSEYYEDLKVFNRSEVVILASVGKGCKDNDKVYVPSGWKQKKSVEQMFVYLNSDKETYVRIKDGDSGKVSTLNCKPVKGKDGVSFNLVCTLPVELVNDGNEYFIIQRVREATRVRYLSFPFFIK